MGLIALEGIKLHAYHGFYPEEQILGTEYIIDVYVMLNMSEVSQTDDLSKTVNYENLFRIVKAEMAKNSKLIETVAQRIINRIKLIYDHIEHLKIRISKLHPPLGADVYRSFVELEENYVQKCDKCNTAFLSQFEGDCWTKHGTILPETKNTLIRNYGNKICKNCLDSYLIKSLE